MPKKQPRTAQLARRIQAVTSLPYTPCLKIYEPSHDSWVRLARELRTAGLIEAIFYRTDHKRVQRTYGPYARPCCPRCLRRRRDVVLGRHPHPGPIPFHLRHRRRPHRPRDTDRRSLQEGGLSEGQRSSSWAADRPRSFCCKRNSVGCSVLRPARDNHPFLAGDQSSSPRPDPAELRFGRRPGVGAVPSCPPGGGGRDGRVSAAGRRGSGRRG